MGRDAMISSRATLASMPLDRLLHTILEEQELIPVRPMEEVLRRDEPVPAIVDALGECPSGELSPAAAWCLVLLGELRAVEAVDTVVDQLVLGIEDNALRAVAAAEALAKIGDAALPRLCDILSESDRAHRLYAYATLGWMATDSAVRILLDAIEWDTPMAGVLALALMDTGRKEAVLPLHGLLGRCARHHRPEVERAIWTLYHGTAKPPRLRRDWRVRYRPARIFSGFDPGWPAEMRVVFKVEGLAGELRPTPPVRSLEEIVALDRNTLGRGTECSFCDEPALPLVGFPACTAHAPAAIGFQITILQEADPNATRETDLFNLLGVADLDLVELNRIRLPPLEDLLRPGDDPAEALGDDLPGESWAAQLMLLQRTVWGWACGSRQPAYREMR
jgi:hypothetical protein